MVCKTGWPEPVLMQDDDYKLAHWLSGRMDAWYLLRYVVYRSFI